LNKQNYLKEIKPMDDVEVKKSNNTNLKVRRIVYYILGVLEVLFAFRLVLKLLGANDESTFVSIIYAITSVLLAPFLAIFRTATTSGIETKAVLEPSTIIGMIVYALVAWGIVKIIEINKVPKN
jgi:glycopeptide antibiotics resistance protein